MSGQEKGLRGRRKMTVTQEFVQRMTSWEGISDGSLSVRIVGEFSAGKTRLLSAVLGAMVPQALIPVSSRDVQTRLPLEVTYGEEPLLTVVEYAPGRDAGAKTVMELDEFPVREQIVAMGLDPDLHRLRLALPLPQLVLPNGDFCAESKAPKRLFLIDMPGWNSIDDHIAEEEANIQMAGRFNLALVYVVNASRLDSAGNKQRLAKFMEVLAEAEFIDRARMLLIITHCGAAESARLQAHGAKQAMGLWADIGMAAEQLELNVLSTDFDAIDPPGLEAFCRRFWQALLAPIADQAQAGHPWVQRIRAWDDAWKLAPKIESAHSALRDLREALLRCRHGELFMPGMNMHRLKGLEPGELVGKLQQHWLRQTRCTRLGAVAVSIDAIRLDAAHPLGPWWAELWQPQLVAVSVAVKDFFDCADEAFRAVTADTIDLETHLACWLDQPYAVALAGVHGSFARLLETAAGVTTAPAEELVATVLSLVALQQRFESACATQLQLIGESAA